MNSTFVVHDLMHDVAQEVMVKKCLIIDCLDLREVFPSTCHLGIWTELAYNQARIWPRAGRATAQGLQIRRAPKILGIH